MKNRYIFISLGALSVALLTAQTLVDLGQTSSSGEIPKWDGSQWQNAHDDVGIHSVVAGDGVDVSENMGVATVSFSQQSLDKMAPVGSVTAWLKSYPNTPSLPQNWMECDGQLVEDVDSPYNGQALPTLNGDNDSDKLFLRGSSVSGGVGGRASHSHSHSQGPDDGSPHSSGKGSVSSTTVPTIPPFYEVVWVIRIK